MYIPDLPEEPHGEDLLERKPFAKRVAETIARYPHASGLVIGIYGVWGEGKSSLLSYMLGAITELNRSQGDRNRLLPVHFNPWYFADERSLIEGFFAALRDALREDAAAGGTKSRASREDLGTMLEKYGRMFAAVSVGVPGFSIKPGEAVVELGKALSLTTLQHLKDKIDTLLLERQRRLVVVIDDIDRLDDNEIHAVFKLVKLVAEFHYVTYVLAFDDAVVAAALGKRYPGGSEAAGRAFLEKIVQVPLAVPKATRLGLAKILEKELKAVFSSAEVQVSDDEWQELSKSYTRGIGPGMTTPRHIKRFANALVFALPLISGEANTVDVILVEAIRVLCPQLYALMRTRREVFVGYDWYEYRPDEASDQAQAKLAIENALAECRAETSSALLWLVQELFPYVSQAFSDSTRSHTSAVGRSRIDTEELTRQKRVASPAYYDRYFFYGVPSEDVADRQVFELMSLARSGNQQGTTDLVRVLAAPRGGEVLASKLIQMVSSTPGRDLVTLALAIAASGDHFRTALGIDRMVAPRTILARLVAKIVTAAALAGRTQVFTEVAAASEPIEFGYDIVVSLPDSTPEREETPIREIQNQMLAVLAARIADADNINPVLASDEPTAMLFLDIWALAGDEAALRESLNRQFAEDPSVAGRLVQRVVPRLSRYGATDRMYMPLGREGYDRISRFIDPGEFALILSQAFPGLDRNRHYERGSVESAVRQFLDLHEAISSSGTPAHPPITEEDQGLTDA